ncbi:MAG: ABC transporter substrate binding protein [Lachnotalea sp.]
MRKKITPFLFSLLFFLFFIKCSLPVYALDSNENKKVLILNSYHSGYTWTDEQTNEILSTLYNSTVNSSISVEYLDWKRYPSQENLTNVYNGFKFKYQDQNIDLIICTDDAAFSFATENRKELFSNAPIVFSGINTEGLANMSPGVTNYTGVLEEIDPLKTLQVAKEINPSLDTIYLVYDNTESGLSAGKLCMQAAQELSPTVKVVTLTNMSTQDILDTVQLADSNSIVLMASYSFNSDNQYISHEQFCQDLSNVSPVPIYHIYDFDLGYGVLGGYLSDGKLLGESTGELAIRILSGEQASSIPIIQNGTARYIFDYSVLEKYNIPIQDLPINNTLINQPFSFIKTYKTLVISVTCIFILLILFTMILLFYIRKINNMKKVLQNNNEELSQLYEELTATEEEIRAQYANLATAHQLLADKSDELYRLAHHDTLTGLKNRLYLYEEIDELLKKTPQGASLFFIDIDNFKFVNDSLGHNIGDLLLKKISERLSSLGSNNHFLIRLGGDEFVYFVQEIESKNSAYQFALDIIKLLSSPFKILENTLALTVSIGISISPENGTDIETLLRNADIAMYKVKNSGKNGVSFFNQLISDELLERINIEKYFNNALNDNEFKIYYQAQIMTDTQKIDGFEALIRWDSPELGMMSPIRFIGISEETGFIITLGEWILRNSCKYIKSINDKYNKSFHLSVNISAIQLMQDNFISIVRDVISKFDFPVHLLELEITETVIMESADLLSSKFKELREMGISIALDDFGTGYSSLAYLKHIPITTLKIDKIFVDDITDPGSEINLADVIIDLGHKMNLSIVAEGVETLEQAEYLQANGCDKIQGYLYSKPTSQQDLEKWILSYPL